MVLTYDAVTIVAETITFYRITRTVVATGVTFLEVENLTFARGTTLTFNNAQPVLKID